MPAWSAEPPHGLGEGGQAHPPRHTHGGAQRNTYSPFLLARGARLRQSFVLLFNLREQTKKSLAGQGGKEH